MAAGIFRRSFANSLPRPDVLELLVEQGRAEDKTPDVPSAAGTRERVKTCSDERRKCMIVRIVRSHLLDPLLTPTKQALLASTILQPDKRWFFRELARHLHLPPSTIQRDLGALAEAGLLARYQDGNRVYYQANRDCPIFHELEQILIKTVGIVETFRTILRPLRQKIDVVFVYGSIASGETRSDSDVDIMLVGSIGLAEIAKLFHGLEVRLGRQVNPTVYTAVEFQKKVSQESHFVRSVLGSKLLFVQGTQHDLERLAQTSKGEGSPDQSRRASRSPRRGRARSQRREA